MRSPFKFLTKLRWTPRDIAGRMAAARRRGTGAYLNDWQFVRDATSAAATNVDDMLEPIVHWCRETVAGTRRPCGISQFDLVVAVHGTGGEPRSLLFEHRWPNELYGAESLVQALRRFLESHALGPTTRVSVALFSWGDAAHRALPADARPA